MTVTDALRDPTAPAVWARDLPAAVAACARDHRPWDRPPAYPPYWLVRSWSGAEPDDIGRSIVERAIYVSPMASHTDHDAAVTIIMDALCRWAHPDDIRWCHLPDADTGGYTVVGTAIRGVSQGEGCSLDDEDVD